MLKHIYPLKGAQLDGRDHSLFTIVVAFLAAWMLPPRP